MSNYITIPLSKTGKHAGKYEAIVSEDDAKFLLQFNWSRNGRGYAIRTDWNKSNPITYTMHRVIMERMIGRPLVENELVDHINRNKLDNRRENLRISSAIQNQINVKLSSRNKSGFKGVSLHKTSGLWRASIRINGVPFMLGYFKTPEEAHDVYLNKLREIHPEYINYDGLKRE